MNENTEKLIRELAAKMGTTAEHLWSVLVKQAIIQSVGDLTILFFFVLCLIFATRFVCRKAKSGDPAWDWDDGGDLAIHSFIVIGICWVVFVFVTPFVLSKSMSAILNPEFWALKQIIY